METTEERIRTTIMLPKGLWRLLQRAALDRDTTASDLVERAIEEWMKKARKEGR